MKIKITTLILLGTLFAGLFIWFGVFNVSAKDKHWAATTALLELTRERSIEVRSEKINPQLSMNIEAISNGAKNYDAMCAQCHLSPITEPTELNLGLYPQPPVFYKTSHEIDPKETYWVIKNGLKMTGMPAWGDFHTDQQLWELVAFLSKIGGMSKAEYKALVGEGGHTHKDGMGHHETQQGEGLNTPSMNTENDHHAVKASSHEHGKHQH